MRTENRRETDSLQDKQRTQQSIFLCWLLRGDDAMSNNPEYREICARLKEIAKLLENLVGIIEKQNNTVSDLVKKPQKPESLRYVS